MYELFSTLKHTGSSDGMTTACYVDGEVIGEVLFGADPRRIVIISEIGPVEQVRENLTIYRARNKPIVKEGRYDYSIPHPTAR